jgi:four helix bundle protein
MAIYSHRDLTVWQKAIEFTKLVYQITARFPTEEKYGLTSQFRRAAVSIPANIAEGRARSSRRDFANFVVIAKGSLMECDTFVVLARQLNYLCDTDAHQLDSLINEIGKMLNTLRARLNPKPDNLIT